METLNTGYNAFEVGKARNNLLSFAVLAVQTCFMYVENFWGNFFRSKQCLLEIRCCS